MFEIKYLTNEQGEKTDVVLPYFDYLDILEEIEDLRTIADRQSESQIEHEEVKKHFLNL